MGENAEGHLLVLIVIGHVVIADKIGDPGNWNRGLEDACLRDQPGAQLPSIADAFHTKSITINPKIASHCGAQTVEHVSRFGPVLISEDGVSVFLSVAG